MRLRSVCLLSVATIAAGLLAVPATATAAAAPGNDDFTAATPISTTLPTTVNTGDPAGASFESWERQVSSDYSGSQWYRYTATTGGLVQFTTTSTVATSYGICVYRGTGTHESLRQVGCFLRGPSSDLGPVNPPVRVDTVAGSTYWVQALVDGTDNQLGGPQTITVRRISHSYPVIANNGVFQIRDSFSTGIATRSVRYGSASDTPVMGDWDGDGTSTVGVVRGNLWLLNDANDSSPADRVFRFGLASDVKLVGDWDGNGTYTPGVFRREGKYGTIYLRNSTTAGPGSRGGRVDARYEPVVGDWSGYGRSELGFYYAGKFMFDVPDVGVTTRFGSAGDRPIVGDWDNDGTDSFGVVRGHSWYLRNDKFHDGPADTSFVYGSNTCQRALTLTQAIVRATCDR